MIQPRPILIVTLLALAIAWAGGCNDAAETKKRIELRDKLIEAKSNTDKLELEIARLQAAEAQQRLLIAELRDLGQTRLAHLFTVDKIELGRYTGPANLDDKPGQDGVRVRISPLDQAGTPIKRAGTVKIQIFDLADQAGPAQIGLREISVEKIGDFWAGHLGTYHFAIDCPWDRPPKTKDLTIRVTFVEYLTGKAFTAQKDVTVDLPQRNEADQPG